jgi:hypothetical protein
MPSSRCVLGRYLRSFLPALAHRWPGKEASDGGDVSQDCVSRSGQNVYTVLGRSMVPGSAGISDHDRDEAAVGAVPDRGLDPDLGRDAGDRKGGDLCVLEGSSWRRFDHVGAQSLLE